MQLALSSCHATKGMLLDETHPNAYTAKNLKGAQLIYSAYDTEFLAICSVLK
jgi:hypothetical protein